jgi:hypothetical protein
MQHIVSANNLRLRIGKQRKRIAKLLRLPLVDIRRIDADADEASISSRMRPVMETDLESGSASGSV